MYDFWKPLDKKYPEVKGAYSGLCYIEAVGECFKGVKVNRNSAFIYHTPFPKIVQNAHVAVVKMIDQDMEWQPHYNKKVSDSIIFPSRIGNIYTGSLWLALFSLIENYYSKLKNVPNEVEEIGIEYDGCYLYSYGSGCGSVLMRGEFMETSAMMGKIFALKQTLDNRKLVTAEEYEALNYFPEVLENTKHKYNTGHFKFNGIHNDERQYLKVR